MNLEPASEGPLHRLSVLVSSFNKQSFLAQSEVYLHKIAELGAQVVIIEDSSTDGSIATLATWRGVLSGSIELVIQKNAGSAASRNKSISKATREFILFVDIDDEVEIDVLSAVFERVLKSNADLALTGYMQMPARKIGSYPLENLANSTSQVALHRSELLEGVGWWRYFYKRETITTHNLSFTPSFKDMGNRIFVLDDLIWLLHIFSMDLTVYRGESTDILYKYFLPVETTDSRKKWYLDQVQLMPEALQLFLKDLKSHSCEHDNRWLYTKSREILWQHANFLDLASFLRTLPNFLRTSILIDFKINRWNFFKTFQSLAYTLLRLSWLRLSLITNPNPTFRA